MKSVSRMARRIGAAAALLLGLEPGWGLAQRAASPAEATVFIRVIGELHAEYEGAWTESVEARDVEMGTGSGFVISPYGHVLTNYHVISDEEIIKTVRGREVKVELDVQRIEVMIPAGEDPDLDPSFGRSFTASVDALDEDLDLAVLSLSGAELPYLPFGDSDAAEPGEAVTAMGFPFGRHVEVGIASVPDIVPRVSMSRGAVSAKRADEEGRVRYLQTSAKLNPGNSGGPLLDGEGFVLGVVRMKLADGEGIGFAIPINIVKDFLELHGLDQLLPVHRMRLGPVQALPGKGLNLRIPESQEDISPSRLRVDSRLESGKEVPLVIDRVASSWNLAELEQALTSGQQFESFSAREGAQKSSRILENRALLGHVAGVEAETGQELKMEYALVDLGKEKLVARFLGPAEPVAFNLSVLRGSLGSMDVSALLTDEVRRTLRDEWAEVSLSSPQAPKVTMPLSWLREETGPFPCPGIRAPDSTLSASPAGDFTVSLIVAWWDRGPPSARASAACSNQPGTSGLGSYAARADWLGISYQIEGIYLDQTDGLMQLEVVAPIDKFGFVRELFFEWVEMNRR